jgi:hypothetical protein
MQSVSGSLCAIDQRPNRVETGGIDQRDCVEVDDEVFACDVAPFHHASKLSDRVGVEGA